MQYHKTLQPPQSNESLFHRSDVSDTSTIVIEDDTKTMDERKEVLTDVSDVTQEEYEGATEENTIVTDDDIEVVDGDSLPTWAIVLIALGGLLVASCLVWLVCTFVCKVTNCLCSSITRICCCIFCCKCHDEDPHGEKVILIRSGNH